VQERQVNVPKLNHYNKYVSVYSEFKICKPYKCYHKNVKSNVPHVIKNLEGRRIELQRKENSGNVPIIVYKQNNLYNIG